jgi:hypothetical protein
MLLRQRLLYNFNEAIHYIEESEKQKPIVDRKQNARQKNNPLCHDQ